MITLEEAKKIIMKQRAKIAKLEADIDGLEARLNVDDPSAALKAEMDYLVERNAQ